MKKETKIQLMHLLLGTKRGAAYLIDLMFPFIVIIIFYMFFPDIFDSTKKDIEKLVNGFTLLTVASCDLIFLRIFKTTLGCKLMFLRIMQSSGTEPHVKDYFYWKLYLLRECIGVIPFTKEVFYFLKHGRTKRDEIFNLYVVDRVIFSAIENLTITEMDNEIKDAA